MEMKAIFMRKLVSLPSKKKCMYLSFQIPVTLNSMFENHDGEIELIEGGLVIRPVPKA
jgi:hypothetical protein